MVFELFLNCVTLLPKNSLGQSLGQRSLTCELDLGSKVPYLVDPKQRVLLQSAWKQKGLCSVCYSRISRSSLLYRRDNFLCRD